MRNALAILALSLFLGCSSVPSRSLTSQIPTNRLIVFMSDFGAADDGTAIVKGVIYGIHPDAKVVDLTHLVPAFSVKDGARYIANTSHYFPPGTVFLSLVDRHVGKPRKGIVIKTKKQQFFVQPDNGLGALAAERDGVEEVREIAKSELLPESAFTSAHAWRDVYAPIAALLSRGEDFSKVGPLVKSYFRLDHKALRLDDRGINGEVIALDGPFGNLITNITSAGLLNAGYVLGDEIPITLGSKEYKMKFVRTFDDVAVNEQLLYVDSTDHLSIAINQGNFASKYKIKPSTKVLIPRSRKAKP